MHGQFAKYLDQPKIRLKPSTLKIAAIETTVAAIQEQAISTKYIEKHFFNVEDDDTY